MSFKTRVEICSVKTGMWTVKHAAATDVMTADLFQVPKQVKVLENVAKAMTIRDPSAVDIRNINKVLRSPQEPAPELTIVSAPDTTR